MEDELREAQRIAHVGSWYWDAQTDATTGSDELLRIYGFDPATQSMPSFREQKGRCYPAEDWERVNAAVQRTLRTGVGYELEVHAIRDNAPIWLTTRGEIVKDTEGRITGLRGTVQDITERKRAEEELLRYQRQLRQRAEELEVIMEVAPTAVWISHDPRCSRIVGNLYADHLMQTPWKNNISAGAPPGEAAVSYKVFRKGVELRPEEMPAQTAVATGKSVMHEELELLFPEGRVVHILCSAVPLFDDAGRVRGMVSVGTDITRLKQDEEQIKGLNEQLKRQVAELASANRDKETLLKELYHRTKNNMNVISGLIDLQTAGRPACAEMQMFKELQSRIKSMSLVHERLYKSKDLSNVVLKDYLTDLTDALLDSYKVNNDRVTLELDIDGCVLSIDAITPLGLAINELMTNSLKYAFPEGRIGKITLEGRVSEEGGIRLVYGDNGIGFPGDFDFADIQTLGLKLVNRLITGQLKGNLEIKTGPETTFTIIFREPQYRKRL